MTLRLDDPLPPAFDAAFYRARHAGLDLSDEAAAADHYAREGRAQGLVASPLALRENLVAAVDTRVPVLEIGPFCQPLLHGPAVEYLDRLDADGLRARAAALGLDPSGCPERIHHLGGLEQVEAERFAAVLASHAIEHQPDLIRHLGEVARVLGPNGRYWLVIPDKRFCFDHFIAPTTVADILDAFHEQRRVHRLGSVVEHAALVTHNDPARHWAGDHGEIDASERARRSAEALTAHRRSDGAYLDVHAWQFTPESFADIGATLARLGLSAFEVERVWDTPHGRAEFCAVLRRARPARAVPRRGERPAVTLLQTADPFRYAPMLAVTQPNVTEYARRHGFGYRSFVGLKRGRWNWQASYNRLPMLVELLNEGVGGWALYLDADAYVRDLDFDLAAYLRAHRDKAAIFATSGVTGEAWDINSGVALVNLDHPQGRALVQGWAARFAVLSDDDLLRQQEWEDGPNDQTLLQDLLREEPAIAAAVHVESMDLLNSAHARFIRQRLRAQFDGFLERVSALRDEVAAVGGAFGVAADIAPVDLGSRAAGKLLHVIEADCWLAEALPGRPGEAAVARALAQWSQGRTAGQGQDAEWVRALDAQDWGEVAAILARLGRAPVARGLLGGDRQHRRAAEDRTFAAERAFRTHDALLSLAELAGAVPIENPDVGPWGRTRKIGAGALFREIEAALQADLAPPPTIGAYLGIEVRERLVLHLRMIEAVHQAWRVRAVADMLGLSRVAEVGGGVGLSAWYARRLGLSDYRLVAPPAAGALQAGVLAPLSPAVEIGDQVDIPLDLLVAEDLGAAPPDQVSAHLRNAVRQGARAFLAFGQDAAPDPARAGPTLLALAEASGWRRVARARHGVRPGCWEELYLPEA